MDIKSNIPKILLLLGSILIFISLFFVWYSYIYLSGDRRVFYGFERSEIIPILILSIVPTSYCLLKNKVEWIIVWIPFLELGIYYMAKSIEVLVTDGTVYEEGFGWIFALIGISLQMIGVIIGILFKLKRSHVMHPRPPAPSSVQYKK